MRSQSRCYQAYVRLRKSEKQHLFDFCEKNGITPSLFLRTCVLHKEELFDRLELSRLQPKMSTRLEVDTCPNR